MRIGSLVGAAAFVVVVGPATLAAADECPPGEGTTVVVDFADLGGGLEVRCAPTAATGFEALAQAGFEVAQVQANPAFVCRIDGQPGTDTEDCVDTPPASAFWSYWSADRGGDWRFQVSGASGSIRGDLEGWAFATGTASPPDYPVPAPATTTTTTTTTTSTTTTTLAPTTSTSTAPTTTTTSAPATSTLPTTTSTLPTTTSTFPTTTSTLPTTASTLSTTTAAATPSTTIPEPISLSSPPEAGGAAGTGRGGAGGFVAGLIAVAGIGVASWMVARRRSGGGGP